MRTWQRLAPLVLAATACGQPTAPASVAHPLLGHPLPELHHRQTLEGREIETLGLAGRPVVVKFFADYCVPCKETLPAAERAHEAHPGVLFLGVDEDESIDTAASVVKRYGLTFPVLHDTGNVLSGRFRVSSLPTTFAVDRSGFIRWVGGEGQTEAELKRAVESVE